MWTNVIRPMKRSVLLLSVVLLTGCATATTPTGPADPSTTSESPVPSTPFSPKPTFSSKPQAEITVVGVVEAGVEHGCTMLRTADELYQLVGSADPVIQPGARLTVRGRPNPNLITTCQQGTPLQVLEVHVA